MTEPTPPRYPGVSALVRAISERMASLRVARGMTRRQLALAAGVHPTQLSQILLGHQGMSLDRAADILGVLGAALTVAALDERAPLRLGHVGLIAPAVSRVAMERLAVRSAASPVGSFLLYAT